MQSKSLKLSQMALAISLALGTGSALAQTDNKQHLNTLVVTAAGFEQNVTEAPASITVITREDLETKQFRDLAEALADVEGVDVLSGTGKTGGLDIRIRGLPSEYTLILIDGRRQNVAGDVTPNGFGAAMTSFMPPLSAIERIEVIRGPMSTLYGSDAVGGVVNVITRKVAPEWGGSVRLEAGVPQDSDWGKTRKVDLYANGPLIDNLLGLAVRASVYDREATKWILAPGANQAGRNPAPGESEQTNIGARLTWTPSQAHDLWLDVDRAETWYNNKDCRLGNVDGKSTGTGGGANCWNTAAINPNAAPGYKDYMEFNRTQLAIGHTSRLANGVVDSSLSHTTTETIGRNIPGNVIGNTYTVDGKTFTIGDSRKLETTNTILDTKYVTSFIDNHVTTLGAQYWQAELEDGLLTETHDQTMVAVFAEDEWRFTDDLAATFGGRYDNHDVFGGQFSPRAYLVWNTSEELVLKGGVNRGFRAPNLNQLIDGINGVGGQGATISIGNPDLKPEISTNTEISALYDKGQGFSGSVTLFQNKIEDRITSGTGDCATNPISSCSANPTATYSTNVDEAKTWGAEISARVELTNSWTLAANYTWTDSEVVEGGEKNGKLGNTPKHMANATLRWATTDQLSLWLKGTYRGESKRFTGDYDNLSAQNKALIDSVGDLKSYLLFDLGAGYRVNQQFNLNATITNLLDKEMVGFKTYEHAGDTYWASEYFHSTQSVAGGVLPGRTFWLSGTYNF